MILSLSAKALEPLFIELQKIMGSNPSLSARK